MKKTTIFLLAAIVILGFKGVAQEEEAEKPEGYVFTEDVLLPHTSIKNQNRSGTCWDYATLSFLEAEILAAGNDTVDLSEAFIVWNTYSDKADGFVRWHGHLNYGGGGAFHDPVEMIIKYGIVPDEVYSGNVIGEELFVHSEMDHALKNYVDGVIKNKNRKLTPVWKKGHDGILNAYLGDITEVDTFTYKGEEYTPESFRDILGLDWSNYIEIGSFTHHPFYEEFILEVPDNWMLGEIYNVPLDEMIEVIDYSLDHGHTIGWGADISEKGFSWTNGVAIVPDEAKEDLTGTEREKWEKLSSKERKKMLFSFDKPVKEKEITQEMRQEGFDNYTTTDDHGMVIVGRAKDQNGTKYYIIKNSWGLGGKYKGYFYASEAFVKLKTMDIMVNKTALPKKIAKKLDL